MPDTSTLLSKSYIRVKSCRYGAMLYFEGDSFVGRSLELYGEFSLGEARMFEQLLKPGMTALDIGANIGCHTVFMAGLVGTAGKIIAFEPQRIVHQALCANLALNAIGNTQAIHAAAGESASSLIVPNIDYEAGGNFGGLSLGEYMNGEPVEVRTIDSLNLKACHFIKIDAEGMENEAIAGAAETLKTCQPYLYVENDRRDRSPELIERLFSAGYRLYWHLPHLFNPDNFFKNDENVFEGLISRNMLCVSKSRQTIIRDMPEITSPDIKF